MANVGLPITIAHHLILHGYGMWLPNDPRGSGSTEVRRDDLRMLGDIHHGRKPVQPPRAELKSFYRRAEPLLEFPVLWFDPPKRQAIGDAFATVARDRRYTVYACAICSNHAHLCVRIHKDDGRAIWLAFAEGARRPLRVFAEVGNYHPVWSNRPYDVFLETPEEVRSRIDYIRRNLTKEGLPSQDWDFVTPYDGWPLNPKRRG